MSRRIQILDTTLRDGEQSPGIALQPHEKAEIAEQLERLGVDVIEAGFPGASPGDFEGVRAVAAAVSTPTVAAAFARTRREDIEAAGYALAGPSALASTWCSPRARSTWRRSFGSSRTMSSARRAGRSSMRPSAPTRSSSRARTRPARIPPSSRASAAPSIAAGVTVINLPDTVGYALPAHYAVVHRRRSWPLPRVGRRHARRRTATTISDLSVANSLAGIEAGAGQVECTINGLGERAGNASLEEIVVALKVRSDYYDVETGIDTTLIAATSRLVAERTGYVVQGTRLWSEPTRSPTRRASTRTGCSRTRARTRSSIHERSASR